jgi:hypothetical protein
LIRIRYLPDYVFQLGHHRLRIRWPQGLDWESKRGKQPNEVRLSWITWNESVNGAFRVKLERIVPDIQQTAGALALGPNHNQGHTSSNWATPPSVLWMLKRFASLLDFWYLLS